MVRLCDNYCDYRRPSALGTISAKRININVACISVLTRLKLQFKIKIEIILRVICVNLYLQNALAFYDGAPDCQKQSLRTVESVWKKKTRFSVIQNRYCVFDHTWPNKECTVFFVVTNKGLSCSVFYYYCTLRWIIIILDFTGLDMILDK